MRELKLNDPFFERAALPGRTPPGVRELKRVIKNEVTEVSSRTPPGVRELKQYRS